MDISQSTQRNIIADSLILYIGIFANLGVLLHLHKTWITRNRVQFYVLSLCLADCLGLILRQCVELGLHTTDTWNTGIIGCKLIMSMSLSGTVLSHFILVNFNIDNLVTVIYKRSPLPVRLALFFSAFCVTGACTAGQGYLYHIEVHPIYRALRQCTPFGQITEQEEMIYNITVAVALFWIPFILVLITAVSVFVILHKGFIRSDEKDEDQPRRDFFTLTSDIKYASVLDGCFIVCWMPYSTQQIFLATETWWLFERKTLLSVWDGFTYLSMLNHCLNPLMYGVYCVIHKKKCESPTRV